MFCGEVGGFADVVFEVIELVSFQRSGIFFCDVVSPLCSCAVRAFFVLQHDLPIAFANGTEVKVLVVEVGTVELGLFAVPDVGDVFSIEDAISWDFCASEGGEGGHEVDGGGDEIIGCAGGDSPWGANDEGDAESAFPAGGFSGAEGKGVSAVFFS